MRLSAFVKVSFVFVYLNIMRYIQHIA